MATVELTGLEMMFSSACTYMQTRFMVQQTILMRQHVVQSELQGLLASGNTHPRRMLAHCLCQTLDDAGIDLQPAQHS